MPDDPDYSNIRKVLGGFIGKRLVDVTQQDKRDWEENREAFVELLFDDGWTMRFPIGDDGFHVEGPELPESPEDDD